MAQANQHRVQLTPPPPQKSKREKSFSPNGRRNRLAEPIAPPVEPVRCALCDLQPLSAGIAAPGSDDAGLFNGLPAHGHCLGHRNTVGGNIRCLARERHERPAKSAVSFSAQVRNYVNLH
jgi:hypothetical protein